ncbi:uncharacterized [Tachysurus ichikawai]
MQTTVLRAAEDSDKFVHVLTVPFLLASQQSKVGRALWEKMKKDEQMHCSEEANQCLMVANVTSCPPHNTRTAELGPLPQRPMTLPSADTV